MAQETNNPQHRYLFNMVFDFIVNSFGVKMDFLGEEYKGRVRSWRYTKKPRDDFFFYTELLNQLEEQLKANNTINEKFTDPKVENFIERAEEKFSDYIPSDQLNIIQTSDSSVVDFAIDLLIYSYEHPEITIIQKAIAAHKNSDNGAPSKKVSPMLDEKMRTQLEELGIIVKSKNDLYNVVLDFAFDMISRHEDEDQAFRWLNDLSFVEVCQERICSFAFHLYDEEDYQRAYKILKMLADAKFEYALIQIGFMYEQGIYVKTNYKTAFFYYLQAANAGSTFAQTCVGDCYLYGKGVEENIGQAYRYYSKVADKNDAEGAHDAQFGVVVCLRSMYLADESEYLQQVLVLTTKKYAEWGNPQVQYILACMYNQGIGVKVDYSLALFWLKKAADAGLEDAIRIIEDGGL